MIKLMKKLTKKQVILIILSIVLIFGQVWFELKMPDYMAEVTRLVQTPGTQISDIWYNGMCMLLCTLGSILIAVISGYLISYISSLFSYNITKELFKKIQSFSFENIEKFSTASLITRSTNDVTQIEMFLGFGMMIFIKSPIMAFWAIRKILNKGIEWTIATGIAVIIMLIVLSFLIFIVIPKIQVLQTLIDKLNLVSRENITGIRVIRAFNAEKFHEDKIASVNEKLTSLQKFIQKSFAIMQPMMMTIMYILTLVIYIIGARLISEAILPDKINIFGNMIVFSAYSMQVIMSFLMMAFLMVMYSRSQVSADRINEVFDTEETIYSGSFSGETQEKGIIEFKNVSFKYPDASEYVLNNISFKTKKGETLAFIGTTGSGKSTLINLVTRFYDVTSGEILIDGINVKEYDFKTLYNKIGYVPQQAVMFNLSVKENIAFGKGGTNVDESIIDEAISISQSQEFVEKMDEGKDSMIARGGTNVSGGQKQRLSIARAIARRAEIFIFDDSFSALDFKTESTLRKQLKENTNEATTLIVASRVGSIMKADKIILLDNGEISGIGTHKKLWENNELYREIVRSQLSEEEINESIK
ncbi:ABC transporter ATP-binding protein [Helcococcus ovis]|uniref:ABC transporter ATP-binding protein n=1 Tax=Helcococcus ovis TaxID=72026 RepID=A0A4R9C1L6_9FIRM|nr:ABC transporter ATP-binding protein [Helcococcus ovis]TFF64293.1 ABC transporter ATP-binding protein [Helcococcus ovis]TFF66548.1 ABC transporter ATP-binding protein [Helcococcus ovis]TFF68872.1 ABC transporter ATP-binding protein [Helcococcus ovis]WNZ00697.1 ABC transporter ATP-binding protein [Helcococcus ovis]